MKFNYIVIDIDKCNGLPCIKGYRFTTNQLLTLFACQNYSLKEICSDFDLDFETTKGAILEINEYFKSHNRIPPETVFRHQGLK